MRDIITRVCEWNEARYEPIENPILTLRLLTEELDEYFQAQCEANDVDKADALIDIIYVAIGAMWKMGLTTKQIADAIHVVCDSNDSKTATKTASHIKANIDKGAGFIAPEPRLQEILDDRQN
mgnify:CR=1 FL=1